MTGLAAVTLILGATAAAGGVPWFERPSCQSAVEAIMAADFSRAEGVLGTLAKGTDVEDKACAAWARAVSAELELSLFGDSEERLQNREKRLVQLFRFAKRYGSKQPHLGALELEARMRRVRVLVDKGKKKEALDEARRVRALLEATEKGPSTPTRDYVIGVTNMAVSQSSWPMRALLGLAGIGGDADLGRKHMTALRNGQSVYRHEATYLSRHFAEESEGGENGRPIDYSASLAKIFPANPQFAYDMAFDLGRERKFAEALAAGEKALGMIGGDPERWSRAMRAKLYLFCSRCAVEVKDLDRGRRYAALAEAQAYPPIEDELEELRERL